MVSCPLIAPFDPEDWVSIESAFRGTPKLTMSQHWRQEPEPHFLPATVQLGHNGTGLLGYAYIPDHEIFTKARQDQELLFQLGDVFEIFLQNRTQKSYVEFHISPNGKRLQLAFPDHARKVMKEAPIEAFMVNESLFDFRVAVNPDHWKIWFAVPVSTMGIEPGTLRESEWRASFSRYDYNKDDATQPVLSSTSQHAELDYHRLEEWTPLTFA